MNEITKAAARRKADPRFVKRWLVGDGIDIGCGYDPLKPSEDFPLIKSVIGYDKVIDPKHDAQHVKEYWDADLDFLISSHCLEHVWDTQTALFSWMQVLKPGGFAVIVVPDEFYYEGGCWPSRFNGDHKVSFSTRDQPLLPSSLNIVKLLARMQWDIEKIDLLTDKWDERLLGHDQSLGPAECAIELVLRKPNHKKPW